VFDPSKIGFSKYSVIQPRFMSMNKYLIKL
jgi:hypothetical protein